MKDQSERGGTRTTLRCVGGGELTMFSHHVTIVTSLTNDLSPEYVDCVEVCYNEIEMEKANGQELEGLRVRLKGDTHKKNSQSPTSDFTFLGLCPNKESV